jgi:DNA polymerase-1
MARTTGRADATIAVVSRSPGQHEALNGKSFDGPSGKVLDHLLGLQGVKRENIIATNVVLCAGTPDEPGWGKAVACCDTRLHNDICEADTVIACGSEASYSLIGSGGVGHNRGYVHKLANPMSNKLQRVIVTNNPAVVLRDDGSFPELVRDFRLAINPLPEPKLPEVRWIEDIDEAKQAVEEILASLKPGTRLSCDIEARGTDGESGLSQFAELVCAGFSAQPERAVVVFGETPCYDRGFTSNYLSRLYSTTSCKYVWHNGKYDVKVLRRGYGIKARVDDDSMLLSWVLDERPGNPESGAGGHSLEWLLKDHLGWPKYEPPSVYHFKKTGRFDYYGTDPADLKRARIDLYKYNGYDTAGTLALFDVLKQEAINDNVYERPYKEFLIDFSEMFTEIESYGNAYDVEMACNILESEVYPKLREYKKSARQVSGKPTLNLNSPTQLSKLIYDDWELKHTLVRSKVERKGKRSTDKYVREEISRGDFTVNETIIHPTTVQNFNQALSNFKELDTQRGTFLEGMILKRSADGRIYTDFKIHGTESGRVSSFNPNLQNITRPKDEMPNVRRCFVPDPGCVFLSADLSQAELRTIAVLSGDESLRSIYTETGRSLHKEVAAQFYGEGYTYEQYVRAKNINFGVVYWQSSYSFAQLYHMPQDEAQGFIDFWWERFPGVWDWTKKIEKQVMETGELQSPFGNKRRFYVIPADESGRLHIVKEGINFQPQNVAAYITLCALRSLNKTLDKRIAQPRITVHDSILVNCREDQTEEVGSIMLDCMRKVPQEVLGWDFPYDADLSMGHTWGDLSEYRID